MNKYSTPCSERTSIDLHTARLLQGITQEELAELSGVSETTIKDYEKDKTGMKLHTLEQLAAGLGKQLIVKFV